MNVDLTSRTSMKKNTLKWTRIACVAGGLVLLSQGQAQTSQGTQGGNPSTTQMFAEHLTGKRQVSRRHSKPQPMNLAAQHADDTNVAEIEMFVGESRVFPTPGVARVAVGNGKILTAAALDDKEVILFANGAGTSSLFVWTQSGQYQRVKINIVPGDTSRIAREIAAFLAAIPNAKASVIGDKVIVEGSNLTDLDLARIDLLGKRYPQLVNFTNPMGFERMVQLDVKVVEFPVSELREFGLTWNAMGGATLGAVWTPIRKGKASDLAANINADTSANVSSDGSPLHTLPLSLNILGALNMGLGATLQALEQEGKTVMLAEPKLSARSGSKATFLAGGEIPYPVSSANGPNIVFKPYGVRLNIEPSVDAVGNIRASIETEVSTIDGSVSTTFGPALLTRKTSTEFNVHSGETIVLSGLIQREQSNNVNKVPGLGEIPIIGALFRSKKFSNKETELVIFVTPTVYDAQAATNLKQVEQVEQRLRQDFGFAPGGGKHDGPTSDAMTSQSQASHVEVLNGKPPVQSTKAGGVGPAEDAAIAVTSQQLKPQPFDEPNGSALRVLRNRAAMYSEPDLASHALLVEARGAIVTLREDPATPSNGNWLPVQTGALQGWMLRSDVEPTRLNVSLAKPPGGKEPKVSDASPIAQAVAPQVSAKPLTLQALTKRGALAVTATRLPLLLTADVNAPVIAMTAAGELVYALDTPPQGRWSAVDYRGQRGWMSTPWLQAVSVD